VLGPERLLTAENFSNQWAKLKYFLCIVKDCGSHSHQRFFMQIIMLCHAQQFPYTTDATGSFRQMSIRVLSDVQQVVNGIRRS